MGPEGRHEAELRAAWERRPKLSPTDEAVRVFHGPGEGSGELSEVAIDRFGDRYWVTAWKPIGSGLRGMLGRFLESVGAKEAVLLHRPEKGTPELPVPLVGEPSEARFECREQGARYWIQLLGTRHPGLFLDHAPLRAWLRENSRGLRVLNTFSYTGSLSVASGLGGAEKVTTLDLAKPVIRWAEENWALNRLAPEKGRFISGDVFEWLPRLARQGELFELVILDPPSFSRGAQGTFSTAKDTRKLHELAIRLVAPGGWIATSINSARIPARRFEQDVSAAARSLGRELRISRRIELPETFPTRPGDEESRYLKGLVARIATPARGAAAPPSRPAGAPRKKARPR
jgi:23S rRNA (cytosine1962-C5)-methyltransferase